MISMYIMLAKNSRRQSRYWDKRRGRIVSRKGKWIGGKDTVFSGFSMTNDLLGKVSYMQVIILNATGKLVEPNIARWFEGNFIGMSYPDSRIWCNQVGTFCGQQRVSVVAGTAAGILCADSRAFGPQTSLYAMALIKNAMSLHKEGCSLEDIVDRVSQKRRGRMTIVGFDRPVKRPDERIVPHEKMRKALSIDRGPYLNLAFELGDFLEHHCGMSLNIAGYGAAFLCDLGFSAEEIYRLKAFSVASGVTAAFCDGESLGFNEYLPLRCDDIEYVGPQSRALPRANID